MRNLLNPRWLFIINTLPIAALFFLFLEQFRIIKTLLNEESIQLWTVFGLILGFLGLLNFAYALFLTIKKQNVSVMYSIVALLSYIPFIYVYGFHVDIIIPFSIPQWMISGNLFIYVATFLMPTIAYSLFLLIAHFTTEEKEYKAWSNFVIAIAIPVLGYLLSQMGSSLWQVFYGTFGKHALLILIITATLVFLSFLIRGIFIIATKKAKVWKKYQLLWKIPVTIALPLIGLSVNNGQLADIMNRGGSGVFGDFNSYWFYVLALVNGILLCLPNLENKIYRMLLFVGRSVMFAFTLYFFVVFLPFLPLSVIAIIAIGTGFLMLTPLLLFVIHINELSKDFSFLEPYFSKKLILGIFSLGFLVIPVCITANYLKDRNVLNKTLEYLYSPDYSKQYAIDISSLQKTLNVIRNHKDNRGGIFWSRQPYLSTCFNWLVLDNLTLSDTKINYIERVFFGETSFELWNNPDNIRNADVDISNISTSSIYDNEQKVWKSWVDLEITNNCENSLFAEYATTIDLPEGCWISDYYLYVGDKREYGVLAEKRSAMWVFSNIRNENRDPGILYYLSGNKVAFRIFPFAQNEVRKTGIEFLHKEPVTLRIDGNTVALGNEEETVYENVETENVAYVSSQQKQSLKPADSKAYYHFLVDVSHRKKENSADFTNRIEKFLEGNTVYSENAKISFVNSYVNTFSFTDDWKQQYQSQTFEGGFYLERAIRMAFFDAYQKWSFPVIIVVTDSIQKAILDTDFSDFKFAFTKSNYFFNLKDDSGYAPPHSLIENPKEEITAHLYGTICGSVLEYELSDGTIVYLQNNNRPSIVLKNDIFEINPQEIQERDWKTGLTLQAKWRSQILHPEISDKEWLNLVKNSFISKIMTPVTSYLVVESEAEKAALKKKQEQVLLRKKSLDLDENSQRMSEPNLWILTILVGLAFFYKLVRKRLRT